MQRIGSLLCGAWATGGETHGTGGEEGRRAGQARSRPVRSYEQVSSWVALKGENLTRRTAASARPALKCKACITRFNPAKKPISWQGVPAG